MSPLVLLPGMNCTADLWSGCGLDDAIMPALTAPSIDAQIAGLLAQLPDRFVLGGLSLGAIVAMALAVHAPDRVAGLVLASTNAKAPTDIQQAGWEGWLQRLAAGTSPRDLQKEILSALLSPTALGEDPALAERALVMADDTGASRLVAQLKMQQTRTDLLSRLPSVSVPTLVVSGAADVICPPAFHQEIAESIEGAELITLDGGHLLPMEHPTAFGGVVREWRARADG